MTDAPETIWRWAVQNCGGFIEYSDLPVISEHSTKYTRTDISQARIAELTEAIIRLRGFVSPFPSENTERYREEYEACEMADAALKAKP
jgi:hypothetical protein